MTKFQKLTKVFAVEVNILENVYFKVLGIVMGTFWAPLPKI